MRIALICIGEQIKKKRVLRCLWKVRFTLSWGSLRYGKTKYGPWMYWMHSKIIWIAHSTSWKSKDYVVAIMVTLANILKLIE